MRLVLGISTIKNLNLVITILSSGFKKINKNFFYFIKSFLWYICQFVNMTIFTI